MQLESKHFTAIARTTKEFKMTKTLQFSHLKTFPGKHGKGSLILENFNCFPCFFIFLNTQRPILNEKFYNF
jgi:hypothetical protein